MNRDDIIRFGEQADEAADRKIQMRGEYHPDWHKVRDQKFAELVQAYEREMCASLVEEMVKHNDGLDDFANSVRKGGRRLCSDGRPKWLKISMEVAAERKACADLCDAHGDDYLGDLIRARGAEPKRHPGYIVGDHWLQAAYTRICTGETETEVMADYGWQRESR